VPAIRPGQPLTQLAELVEPAEVGDVDDDLDHVEAMMHADEQIAEKVDAQKYAAELSARQAEVDDAIADGAQAG
jgi:hypothetical protein